MEESKLKQIVTIGKQKAPVRVCIYGEHGIGKSTFCSEAPNPIFLQVEDGLNNIDTAKLPLAQTIEDIREQLMLLLNEEHDYKTLVIDSLDWLEKIINESIAKKFNKQSVADFDFGIGYQKALELYCALLKTLDTLRTKKGMNIFLTAHATIKEHKDPLTQSYDRYTLALRDKIAAKTFEWCDCVSFITYEVAVIKEGQGFNEVKRGKSNNARMMFNQMTPGYEAKNRYSLPDKMELNFKNFWGAICKE